MRVYFFTFLTATIRKSFCDSSCDNYAIINSCSQWMKTFNGRNSKKKIKLIRSYNGCRTIVLEENCAQPLF